MDNNYSFAWQDDFINNYVAALPDTALLFTPTGMGKTVVSLKIWDRLSADHDYKNLIVLPGAGPLQAHWQETVNESISQINTPLNTIIYNTHQYYNDAGDLLKLKHLFHSSKSFVIADEIHKKKNLALVNEILSDFNQNNTQDSKILCLSGLDPQLFKEALDDMLPAGKQYIYDRDYLAHPQTKIEIARYSPSYGILQRILDQGLHLDNLSWREFEKLVAQLLESDGFNIELMQGTRDGGVDIIATKLHDISGYYKTLWQAKKYAVNKVSLSTIRELADSVNEFRASKGIIVTTTFLTKDALQRVERDKYTLGKVDRDDLDNWIKKVLWK